MNHQCALCGSENPSENDAELDTIRSRMSEKLRAKKATESDYKRIHARLEASKREEAALQSELNSWRFEYPIVTLTERQLPEGTRFSLSAERDRLVVEEADLEIQIVRLSADLDAEYRRFRERADIQIQRLRNIFADYATRFLGHHCTLTEVPQIGHSTVSMFVPEFNGAIRESSDACSEAQRFFLDIALRMALIDMATQDQSNRAIFICETPETALDVSYVDNVVRMMSAFCEKGNVLLLTANIQDNGIAEKLLHTLEAQSRPPRLLSLLRHGRLSDVQRRALEMLEACVFRVLNSEQTTAK
jgi:hypothetical protein